VEHLRVVDEELGLQGFDAAPPGRTHEPLEEQGAEPAALPGVLDGEGRLGGGWPLGEPLVARPGHDLAAHLRDQRVAPVVVHVGEVLGLLGVPRGHREEAEVEGLLREPVVRAQERHRVGRAHGPHEDGGAVPEQDRALVFGRVGKHSGTLHEKG
jgi:hypothetical protein